MVALGLPWGAVTWETTIPDGFFDRILQGASALFVLLFVAYAIRYRRGTARRSRLASRLPGSRAFLRERGWDFVPSGAITWTRPLAAQPLAGFRNLVVVDFAWGMSDGVVCAAFVARLPGTIRIAIEMADLPRPLPPILLCPAVLDNTFTKIPSAHPFLSESADFNATWVVRAQDPRYASSILSPRVMERLLHDDASDLWLIIDGGAVISITEPAIIPNDRIAAHLAVLQDLIALIPQATYNEFATGAPANSWGWAAKTPKYSWLIARDPEDPYDVDSTVTDTVGTFFPQDFDPDK
jgi:hypothetical protein